ncbi:hypothetical protein [Geoglobus ahangari]|uniref:hypothetical protein n=1 Tax=Geoglobus ahangari TaxID=113653 RepID=UPI001FE1E877|nr:hypothetical protein [Geoglobus ahangari]
MVACMLCHEWSPDETNNYGPPAGGFNVSDFGVTSPYNYGTKNGTYEAHNAFIARAIQDGTLQDANEACIACHTHVAVKITWNHSRALEFNIGFGNPITTANGPHNWTITSWTINGTATAVVWGNTTGSGSTTYSTNWPGNVPGVNYK